MGAIKLTTAGRQLLDESADHFITEIHRLADNCEFGDMKDQLIRNRLVVGIQDGALSERLQLESDLTLDKAKTLIRQREAVRGQQEIPVYNPVCARKVLIYCRHSV